MNARYHRENESQPDPRFLQFRPGVISENLRQALNYRKDQLPAFIYKMRYLGYPPGWLMDAEHRGSGITMYDCDGVGKPGV